MIYVTKRFILIVTYATINFISSISRVSCKKQEETKRRKRTRRENGRKRFQIKFEILKVYDTDVRIFTFE